MKKHYRTESDCLNCGANLHGKFCHACGQENLQIKENFGHMLNHAVSDYFHFDHQFFHTLKPLIFKPGKLTNEYMAGKRVQYLHPVKMYIFISLVYFLVLFSHNADIINISTTSIKPITKEQLAKSENEIMRAKNFSMQYKKYLIAKLRADTVKHKLNNTANDHIHIFSNDVNDNSKGDSTYAQYLATQQKLPAGKRDNFIKRYGIKREFEVNEKHIDIKQLIEEGVKHNTPKMMFLMLPVFALLLRITFWKNRKFYVEHLIYSFHFHCFLFLFLTVIMLVKMVAPAGVNEYLRIFACLTILWYFYQSLRAVYHRTPARTITKMIGITFSYTTIFGLCMLLLVVIVALFD